jgi:hypothetical protein
MKFVALLLILLITGTGSAMELEGFVGHSVGIADGEGFHFGILARQDSQIATLEGGVLRTSASRNSVREEKVWILPALVSIPVRAPFVSLALGPDYAITPSSHFGLESAMELNQDLGNNFSAIVDIRYREGLGGNGLRFFLGSFGLQKRLE